MPEIISVLVHLNLLKQINKQKREKVSVLVVSFLLLKETLVYCKIDIYRALINFLEYENC